MPCRDRNSSSSCRERNPRDFRKKQHACTSKRKTDKSSRRTTPRHNSRIAEDAEAVRKKMPKKEEQVMLTTWWTWKLKMSRRFKRRSRTAKGRGCEKQVNANDEDLARCSSTTKRISREKIDDDIAQTTSSHATAGAEKAFLKTQLPPSSLLLVRGTACSLFYSTSQTPLKAVHSQSE